MIYTLSLNPALDYVMQTGALRPDDVNRSKSEHLSFGGKGINVSAVLCALGVENKALGFVGGATGDMLEQLLHENGISADFVRLAQGNTRINVKIEADTALEFNAAGPTVTPQDMAALFAKLDTLQRGDYLVLSGTVPKGVSENVYEQILQRLNGKGVQFIVDAAGALLLNTLPYEPFLIKPNHHELGALFGVSVQTSAQAAHYAKELQQRGAQNVLVSRAEDGALLLDATGTFTAVENAAGETVNTVGCGDSMLAGFLAGFLQTQDYAYALHYGTACGNATAFSQGLARKEEVERIFKALCGKQNLSSNKV